MIALDTNVLVRYLLRDDHGQFSRASRAIEHAIERGAGCLLTSIVLCELVWVLEACAGAGKPEICRLLRELLMTSGMYFEHRDCVARALDRFDQGKGDFADYLIGETALRLHAQHTVTFDKALRGTPGFSIL